jgi:hypothetical protein
MVILMGVGVSNQKQVIRLLLCLVLVRRFLALNTNWGGFPVLEVAITGLSRLLLTVIPAMRYPMIALLVSTVIYPAHLTTGPVIALRVRIISMVNVSHRVPAVKHAIRQALASLLVLMVRIAILKLVHVMPIVPLHGLGMARRVPVRR